MTPLSTSSHLSDGRHAVRFGDGIALLDVAGDAYSCIYDPTGHTAALSFPDTRSIALEPALPPVEQQACGPWRDLPAADAKVGPRDMLRFVSALIVTAIRFHRYDLANLLATGADRTNNRTASPDELATIVARFEHMALFLPIPILCLFRSFFLLHFLERYGHTADWVFGVTLFPFRAHCWLASGDLLLGERLERAMAFSPIHMVRARRP